MPGSDQGHSEPEQGQATVELALVLPVVVLFALLVVQVGLVAKDLVLVQHAAREGARAAAVDPTPSAARAGAFGSSSLEVARMTVTLGGSTSRGGAATTTVHYRSPTNVPLVGALVGDIALTAEVTMRVE
ncbi:MAG: Flp pilus assembly protein TadG [Acidimicrobiales bacterium]|jgi:Flp pilus assembly protein TadG